MTSRTLLFLDFDGVICDSALECFTSSAAAYGRIRGEAPPDSEREEKLKFDTLRPFVRNSEDYLFIQEIIHLGTAIGNQADFDAYIDRSTEAKRKDYRRLFYEARSKSLAEKPDEWLDSNPLFPHMKEPLRAHASDEGLYILSTKKGEFITAILSHHGITMDSARIISSGENERKLDLISKILDEGIGGNALFVDDQVDHLKGNTDPRITVCLPLWGYIEKSCIDSIKNIRAISERDVKDLFSVLDERV